MTGPRPTPVQGAFQGTFGVLLALALVAVGLVVLCCGGFGLLALIGGASMHGYTPPTP